MHMKGKRESKLNKKRQRQSLLKNLNLILMNFLKTMTKTYKVSKMAMKYQKSKM